VQGRLAGDTHRTPEALMPHVSSSTTSTLPHEAMPRTARGPVVLPRSAAAWWLAAAAVFSLLVYYFVGVDQGALSVFGNDMHIHELVHDGRHVLAFPCH
jgi:Probable cobalt transporter subunit (CbtB)